jgi:replication factor C subunit 1
MRLHSSADKRQVRMEYMPSLSARLTSPLKEEAGIDEVINIMDEYYLTRDDWDSIMEMGYSYLATTIPSKIKTAFTRK